MKNKKSNKIKKFFKRLAIFIGIQILIVVILFLFRNPIGDFVIESAGSKIVGAKVDVDGLNINPFSLGFSWDRLQITNPDDTMTNSLEAGYAGVDIQIPPLLSKKVIIDEISLEDIRFNTRRETDGKIDKKVDEKSPKADEPKDKEKGKVLKQLDKKKSEIPVLNPGFLSQEINVDKIMEELDLKTPEKIEGLKDTASERYDYWNKKIAENEYEDRLKSIETQLKSINVNNLTNIDEIKNNISNTESLIKEIEKIGKDISNERMQLEKDLDLVRNLGSDIPEWIDEDYKSTLKKASLEELDLENIASVLFGDKLSKILVSITESVIRSRTINKELSDENRSKKEKKPDNSPLPSLWIKKMNMSLMTTNNIALAGTASDISTSHNKTGKPMIIDLSGTDSIYGDLFINTVFDYTQDRSIEDVAIRVEKLPVRDFDLSSSPLLPKKVDKGNGKAEIKFVMNDDDMAAKVGFIADELKFNYDDMSEDKLGEMIRSVTSNIDIITAEAEVKTVDDELEFSLDSNLDEVLSAEIKRLQGKEVEKAKKELRDRVEKELSRYTKEFDNYILEQEKKLTSRYDFLDDQFISQSELYKSKDKGLNNMLDSIVQKQAEEALKKAEEEAIRKAEEAKRKAEEELKKQAEEKAGELLEGLGF